jgi:hypothetical protein
MTMDTMTQKTIDERALVIIEQERDTILSRCQITVVDTETEMQAAQALSAIRSQLKKIDIERKTWTDPLEQQKKRLIEVFKKLTQPLTEAENYIDSQLRTYRMKLEALRMKEEARLRALQEKRNERAAEKGKPSPLPETIIPFVQGSPKTVQSESGSVTYVERWKAEIIDITKVPYQFLLPDMVSLNKLAQAMKGENPPSGVVFKKEISTRVG